MYQQQPPFGSVGGQAGGPYPPSVHNGGASHPFQHRGGGGPQGGASHPGAGQPQWNAPMGGGYQPGDPPGGGYVQQHHHYGPGPYQGGAEVAGGGYRGGYRGADRGSGGYRGRGTGGNYYGGGPAVPEMDEDDDDMDGFGPDDDEDDDDDMLDDDPFGDEDHDTAEDAKGGNSWVNPNILHGAATTGGAQAVATAAPAVSGAPAVASRVTIEPEEVLAAVKGRKFRTVVAAVKVLRSTKVHPAALVDDSHRGVLHYAADVNGGALIKDLCGPAGQELAPDIADEKGLGAVDVATLVGAADARAVLCELITAAAASSDAAGKSPAEPRTFQALMAQYAPAPPTFALSSAVQLVPRRAAAKFFGKPAASRASIPQAAQLIAPGEPTPERVVNAAWELLRGQSALGFAPTLPSQFSAFTSAAALEQSLHQAGRLWLPPTDPAAADVAAFAAGYPLGGIAILNVAAPSSPDAPPRVLPIALHPSVWYRHMASSTSKTTYELLNAVEHCTAESFCVVFSSARDLSPGGGAGTTLVPLSKTRFYQRTIDPLAVLAHVHTLQAAEDAAAAAAAAEPKATGGGVAPAIMSERVADHFFPRVRRYPHVLRCDEVLRQSCRPEHLELAEKGWIHLGDGDSDIDWDRVAATVDRLAEMAAVRCAASAAVRLRQPSSQAAFVRGMHGGLLRQLGAGGSDCYAFVTNRHRKQPHSTALPESSDDFADLVVLKRLQHADFPHLSAAVCVTCFFTSIADDERLGHLVSLALKMQCVQLYVHEGYGLGERDFRLHFFDPVTQVVGGGDKQQQLGLALYALKSATESIVSVPVKASNVFVPVQW